LLFVAREKLVVIEDSASAHRRGKTLSYITDAATTHVAHCVVHLCHRHSRVCRPRVQ
jgi:hypothetical protein